MSLCSFATSSQSLSHMSLLPGNIHLLTLLLIQSPLKLAKLFVIITMITSEPGTFRNKRCSQEGNLRGCSLRTILLKLAEEKCIVCCVYPI